MRLCTNCVLLQDRIDRIMSGLEGTCMTCEPVGHRNRNMESDLQELKAIIERLTAERDEARREVLLLVKERCAWAELSDEIKKRGWGYLFKEDGK